MSNKPLAHARRVVTKMPKFIGVALALALAAVAGGIPSVVSAAPTLSNRAVWGNPQIEPEGYTRAPRPFNAELNGTRATTLTTNAALRGVVRGMVAGFAEHTTKLITINLFYENEAAAAVPAPIEPIKRAAS